MVLAFQPTFFWSFQRALVPLLCALAANAAPEATTPAERKIVTAQKQITAQPDYFGHYNELAIAFVLRAEETSDANYLSKAEAVLAKSFQLSRDNFEARRAEAWTLIDRGEYSKALDLALRLNKQIPDDVIVRGYVSDAYRGLGDYEEALDAAQWMLTLRRNNVPGLVRGVYLREVFGDIKGAIELAQLAYGELEPGDTDTKAVLLSKTAHLYLLSGNLSEAETSANEALNVFPGHPCSLSALEEVRLAQKRYEDAASLVKRKLAAVPLTADFYLLAEAQRLAGLNAEAEKNYAMFEKRATSEAEKAGNANVFLVRYYVDRAKTPDQALKIAKLEIARRHDVYTIDCYAWALAANGSYDEANTQLHKALSIGVKDADLLYHAGYIALHLHQKDKALAYLKDAQSRFSPASETLLRDLESSQPK